MRPTKRRRRLHLVSVTEGNAWVRDRENLREISRCAHLEGEEVTYVRSAPTRTPADHPWLSQGSSQAERLGDWALVREKVAVRPPPPLRTRAGEATQRGLFVAGRREAPHTASTGGAQAGHPIVASDRETKSGAEGDLKLRVVEVPPFLGVATTVTAAAALRTAPS